MIVLHVLIYNKCLFIRSQKSISITACLSIPMNHWGAAYARIMWLSQLEIKYSQQTHFKAYWIPKNVSQLLSNTPGWIFCIIQRPLLSWIRGLCVRAGQNILIQFLPTGRTSPPCTFPLLPWVRQLSIKKFDNLRITFGIVLFPHENSIIRSLQRMERERRMINVGKMKQREGSIVQVIRTTTVWVEVFWLSNVLVLSLLISLWFNAHQRLLIYNELSRSLTEIAWGQ